MPLLYNGFAVYPTWNGVLDWVHTFSPTVINDARFGINYVLVNNGAAPNGVANFPQTVGLPAGGLTHVGVQWTKYDLAAGAVVDGGRIEDPSATATNGGKWYDFSHLAVNRFGDIVFGFTEFASDEHASAGYALHSRSDPPRL